MNISLSGSSSSLVEPWGQILNSTYGDIYVIDGPVQQVIHHITKPSAILTSLLMMQISALRGQSGHRLPIRG